MDKIHGVLPHHPWIHSLLGSFFYPIPQYFKVYLRYPLSQILSLHTWFFQEQLKKQKTQLLISDIFLTYTRASKIRPKPCLESLVFIAFLSFTFATSCLKHSLLCDSPLLLRVDSKFSQYISLLPKKTLRRIQINLENTKSQILEFPGLFKEALVLFKCDKLKGKLIYLVF